MKLKELRKICEYSTIELHNSYDGKLVAYTPKSLDKYDEVEVLSIYPKIKTNKEETFANSYLYVFGNSFDIDSIKKEQLCVKTIKGLDGTTYFQDEDKQGWSVL